ncbi:MAG: exopolysaccharide biosynthesis protein [Alphaproteobacteria bacterium]
MTLVSDSNASLRTSELIVNLLDRDHHQTITIQSFLDSLGDRVYGLGMLLWVLPNCIPMIPGVAGVTGVMIMIMALQMALGQVTPWLPRAVRNRPLPRMKLLEISQKAIPRLRRLETFIRPRYHFLDNRAMRIFTALVIVVMAFILLLPIPIVGNMPPAWAIALLSMSLIERDGLILLLGMAASVAATYFIYIASEAAIHALFR